MAQVALTAVTRETPRVETALALLAALTWVILCLCNGLAHFGSPGWQGTLQATLLPPTDWHVTRDQEVFGLAAAVFLLVHVGCAAGFLALPVSRRREKVRWDHIGRVVAYGAVLLVVPMWGVFFGAAIMQQPDALARVIGGMTYWVCTAVATFGLVPLEIVWWSTATGRYLKMRHAWGVGASVVVMSALAVALLATVTWLLLFPWPP